MRRKRPILRLLRTALRAMVEIDMLKARIADLESENTYLSARVDEWIVTVAERERI